MLVTRIRTSLEYEIFSASEFFLNMLVSKKSQLILEECLSVDYIDGNGIKAPVHFQKNIDAVGGRFVSFPANQGTINVDYTVNVVTNNTRRVSEAAIYPIGRLPKKTIPCLRPSRYCQSDELSSQVQALFCAQGDGIVLVESIIDWIQENIQYEVGFSNSTTSAVDVFEKRKGVCRDFAHLAITFCRALNIPARFCVGYVYFEEPPQDFHAIFEAYLGGRWIKFDPTRLAPPDSLVVIARGNDAKDTPFATIFGNIKPIRMRINIEQEDPYSDLHLKAGDEQAAIIGR
ncbi:transglutaminase-like putative cysteine protease [Advenella incenata]|uniref:Transglutaminase-like putative cysteine protease n=1 Tax=Advenella incenata TaxID=267800 RepID=A0A4Q7VSN5_9BURK|nr:transglutaminase family protein [Advenella incenata]RZT99566.1 transglutaminase-like putative cysteine protease [Advenella incenata]